MIGLSSVEVQKLPIEDNEIFITETDVFSTIMGMICLNPTYYSTKVIVSPLVAVKMLRWLIANHYVILDGKLTIKVRQMKVNYGE